VATVSENTHASEIDRLIHSSKDVIAAARRPAGLEAEVPVSSAVKVAEGRAGAPEVRIETAWERVVPAAELGDAVTAAITSFLRERQPAVEPEEELPAWHPDTSGQNLNAAMQRINAALDASFAKLGEAQGQLTGVGRATLSDERGRVRAQAQDGHVTSVEIDPAWATGKSGATIGMEISGVMADAATTRTEPADPLATDPRAVYEFLRETL
jgi:hypothetical protein